MYTCYIIHTYFKLHIHILSYTYTHIHIYTGLIQPLARNTSWLSHAVLYRHQAGFLLNWPSLGLRFLRHWVSLYYRLSTITNSHQNQLCLKGENRQKLSSYLDIISIFEILVPLDATVTTLEYLKRGPYSLPDTLAYLVYYILFGCFCSKFSKDERIHLSPPRPHPLGKSMVLWNGGVLLRSGSFSFS